MDKLLKTVVILGIIIISLSIFWYYVVIPYQIDKREKFCIDKIGIDYHGRIYDSYPERFHFCLMDNN